MMNLCRVALAGITFLLFVGSAAAHQGPTHVHMISGLVIYAAVAVAVIATAALVSTWLVSRSLKRAGGTRAVLTTDATSRLHNAVAN